MSSTVMTTLKVSYVWLGERNIGKYLAPKVEPPPRCGNATSHTPLPAPCVSAQDRGQAARQTRGLVCGTVLSSTGVWRQKAWYLLPQSPSRSPKSLSFFLSSFFYVSGGCFHHTACVARFVKDVAASCLFHGRLPSSLHIFRPLSFSHLFPSLALFSPHTSAVYLLMNSVSQAQALALPQGEVFFFPFSFLKMRTVWERSLARWHSHMYQGRVGRSTHRSAHSLCPPHHASSAICEQCVKSKTDTPFPWWLGGVCLLHWPNKGQKSMDRQRKLYIPSEQ